MNEEKRHPGQPPKYSSPKELKQKADEYFAEAILGNWYKRQLNG